MYKFKGSCQTAKVWKPIHSAESLREVELVLFSNLSDLAAKYEILSQFFRRKSQK